MNTKLEQQLAQILDMPPGNARQPAVVCVMAVLQFNTFDVDLGGGSPAETYACPDLNELLEEPLTPRDERAIVERLLKHLHAHPNDSEVMWAISKASAKAALPGFLTFVEQHEAELDHNMRGEALVALQNYVGLNLRTPEDRQLVRQALRAQDPEGFIQRSLASDDCGVRNVAQLAHLWHQGIAEGLDDEKE